MLGWFSYLKIHNFSLEATASCGEIQFLGNGGEKSSKICPHLKVYEAVAGGNLIRALASTGSI